MQFPDSSTSPASKTLPILESRQAYRSCHISLTGSPERLAAIQVNGAYYSFFKFEKDQQRAIAICHKLHLRDYTAIITRVPKGFAIWVLEPNASPAQSKQPISDSDLQAIAAPYQVITTADQYRSCYIRVPDLDKQLVAIAYNSKLYSLFKSVNTLQEALQFIRRLADRGDGAVITTTASSFTIWIEEPDAALSQG